ncbi:MAG: hypothetical protein LHV68_07130 [Elusimicrobia bacterium]|nr:hypothetical protein [Candidatus Liberimonas magnetica]
MNYRTLLLSFSVLFLPIIAIASIVTFEPYPWDDPTHKVDILNGAIVTQGDTSLPVMKFRLKTDTSEAAWSKIRVERIGQGAAGQNSGGSNSDIAHVKIFKDSNGDEKFNAGDTLISSGIDKFPLDVVGPACDITLAQVQTLGTVPQVYFVVYDIATTAYSGNSIGVKIKDYSSLTVDAPSSVAVFSTSAPFQAGGWFQSSYATILPIRVKVECQNLAPEVKLPGDKNIPILKAKFASESNTVILSSITVYQTGDISRPQSDRDWYLGVGDGDFSAIKLWRDDSDGVFDETKDTQIDSIPSKESLIDAAVILRTDAAPIRCFSGGLATLYCGDLINQKGQNYFITADIGTTDLGGKPVFQHLAGLEISSYSDISIVPHTSVSSASNAFPYISSSLRLGDVIILNVNIRPDKSGVHTEAWWNSTTKVSVKWDIIKVAQAQIVSYMTAIGSNPDLEDMTIGMGQNGWLSTGPQSIDISELALSEPMVTFLAADLSATQGNGTNIQVYLPAGHPRINTSATSGFDSAGSIVIGKEIIGYTDTSADSFRNITRGLHGTSIEAHSKSDQVTNHAYFVKVKAVSSLAGITPQAWGVIKIDMSPPSSPTNVLPSYVVSGVPAAGGKYEVKWVTAKDFESGVEQYEIQEYSDTNFIWKTIDAVTGDKNSINVGDGIASDIDGTAIEDNPRNANHLYWYRVRAKNYAGSWGPWSAQSSNLDSANNNHIINDNGIKIDIPTGTLTTSASIEISTPSVSSLPALSNDSKLKGSSKAVEIKLSDGTTSLAKEITLTILYTAEDVGGLNENNLKLFYFDTAKSMWVLIPNSTVDTSRKVVTANVNHLTIFRIMEYAAITNAIEDLSNYPNPFKAGVGSTKIRYTLKQDSDVKITIYDLIGGLVLEKSIPRGVPGSSVQGPNEVSWDGRNGSGKIVDIGAYICVVECDGTNMKTKIGVK